MSRRRRATSAPVSGLWRTGRGGLTLGDFEKASGIDRSHVYTHFPDGWHGLLRRAGLSGRAVRRARVEDRALMEERA